MYLTTINSLMGIQQNEIDGEFKKNNVKFAKKGTLR